jgi:hypothetical protein
MVGKKFNSLLPPQAPYHRQQVSAKFWNIRSFGRVLLFRLYDDFLFAVLLCQKLYSCSHVPPSLVSYDFF